MSVKIVVPRLEPRDVDIFHERRGSWSFQSQHCHVSLYLQLSGLLPGTGYRMYLVAKNEVGQCSSDIATLLTSPDKPESVRAFFFLLHFHEQLSLTECPSGRSWGFLQSADASHPEKCWQRLF